MPHKHTYHVFRCSWTDECSEHAPSLSVCIPSHSTSHLENSGPYGHTWPVLSVARESQGGRAGWSRRRREQQSHPLPSVSWGWTHVRLGLRVFEGLPEVKGLLCLRWLTHRAGRLVLTRGLLSKRGSPQGCWGVLRSQRLASARPASVTLCVRECQVLHFGPGGSKEAFTCSVHCPWDAFPVYCLTRLHSSF